VPAAIGWLRTLIRAKSRLTVVELGAGKAIPTVRIRAERIAAPSRRRVDQHF
jgi:hypothetical protein